MGARSRPQFYWLLFATDAISHHGHGFPPHGRTVLAPLVCFSRCFFFQKRNIYEERLSKQNISRHDNAGGGVESRQPLLEGGLGDVLGRVTLLGTEYVSICQLEIGPVLSPPFFFFLSKRAGNYFSAKAEKWAGGDFFFFFFFFFRPPKMVASQILTGLVVLVVDIDFAHFVSAGLSPPQESIPPGRMCQ